MDSKTRAKVRAIASSVKPSVMIGKEGLTETVIKQIDMNLTAHELVKISVLPDADYKELLNEVASKLKAEPICAIGKKLVVYRYSSKKKQHVLEV